MFADYPLTLSEFFMSQATPLAEIHRFVLEQLRLRPGDAVIIGAQAVNAWVPSQIRMTTDIDVASTSRKPRTRQDSTSAHRTASASGSSWTSRTSPSYRPITRSTGYSSRSPPSFSR